MGRADQEHESQLDPYTVRSFARPDLEGVLDVEREAFGEEPYPAASFIQFHELDPDLFLVAENQGGIIGYAVAAAPYGAERTALLLSTGVKPTEQRQGIGRSLVSELTRRLESTGVHSVALTVHPDNTRAIDLYRSLGFEQVGSLERNFFGKGGDRLRFCKVLQPQPELNPDRLIQEAGASLQFTALVAVIAGALLAGFIALDADGPVGYWYVFLSLFGAFYSSIFYANVSGSVARLGREAEAVRPLVAGNAVSEYLGVWPLVVVFPLAVFEMVPRLEVAVIAAAVDVLTFALYQMSGFDIFSRQTSMGRSRRVRASLAALLVSLAAVGHLLARFFGWGGVGLGLAAATSVALVALTLQALRRDEW